MELKKTTFSSWSYKKIIEEVQKKSISLTEIGNILKEDSEKLKDLNIFISQDFDQTFTKIPIAIKDNFSIKGKKTTAGSLMLKDYISPINSTVVSRLSKHVDFYGKVNLDEFAAGSFGVTSAFGPTKSPWSKGGFALSPGGSSSGSAAVVAAGLSFFSMGSDTGGSVRLPSAWCGLFGLKPTYGVLSRYGIVDFGSSLDVPGIMTKTLGDCELVFSNLIGKDDKDLTTYDYSPQTSKKRVAVLKEAYYDQVDKSIFESVNKLRSEGYEILEFSSKYLEYALPIYYILASSEFASNLSRYTGVFYNKPENPKKIEDLYNNFRSNYFGEEIKRRIISGNFTIHSSNREGYYNQAKKVLQLLWEEWSIILDKVDAVLMPISKEVPLFKDTINFDPLEMHKMDTYTCFVNLLGIPAMTVPIGLFQDGSPMSIQLISKPMGENLLFEVGKKMDNGFFEKYYGGQE